MKTTIDIPDALMIRAKKRAVELHKPLRELVLDGLTARLDESRHPKKGRVGKKIRWVCHRGGLPKDLDLADRGAMTEWLNKTR